MSPAECRRIVMAVWNGGERDSRFPAALKAMGLSIDEFDRLLREARKTEGRFPKRLGLAPIGSGKKR